MVQKESDTVEIKLVGDRQKKRRLKESWLRTRGISLGTRNSHDYKGHLDRRIHLKLMAIHCLRKRRRLSLGEVLSWCRSHDEFGDAREVFYAVRALVIHGKDSDPPKKENSR